jgi:hypothetical protein
MPFCREVGKRFATREGLRFLTRISDRLVGLAAFVRVVDKLPRTRELCAEWNVILQFINAPPRHSCDEPESDLRLAITDRKEIL